MLNVSSTMGRRAEDLTAAGQVSTNFAVICSGKTHSVVCFCDCMLVSVQVCVCICMLARFCAILLKRNLSPSNPKNCLYWKSIKLMCVCVFYGRLGPIRTDCGSTHDTRHPPLRRRLLLRPQQPLRRLPASERAVAVGAGQGEEEA